VQSKRIEKVFDFVAKIGQGSFGSVYKAQLKLDERIYQNESAVPSRPVISAAENHSKIPSKSLNLYINDANKPLIIETLGEGRKLQN
jgi:hypothetical protein